MGPDFLDRQSLWYMFCCNFICLLFFNLNFFFLPDIRSDTGYKKKAGYPVQP